MPAAKTNRDYHTTRVKSAPEHRAVAAAGLADGQREYFNGLLGELLVSRNSTALIELIKNAYDADASRVIIDGKNLDNTKLGEITVSDDGVGMNAAQFERGFLTIAGRMKDSQSRRSLKFKRYYTGAKGIGRLAAHKLARYVEIESCPDPAHIKPNVEILSAAIDWDIIETKTLVSQIADSNAIVVTTTPRPKNAKSGTTIKLKRLRKKWTDVERVQFQSEVESFRPPEVLIKIPDGLIKGRLLIEQPIVADAKSDDNKFECELAGSFATGDEFWPSLAASAHWLLEIDAHSETGKVRVRISPTKRAAEESPEATQSNFAFAHPDHQIGPHFHARILIRRGETETRAFKQWLSRSYGIRVYNEGFRVLPYGEPQNDWLSIDADYRSRPKTLSYLESTEFGAGPDDANEGLSIIGNNGYFGAVYLTSTGATNLRMLINREGFVADQAFENLVSMIRTAVYLSVRVRAAASLSRREDRREQREVAAANRLELKQAVEATVEKATKSAREAKELAAKGDVVAAKAKIDEAAGHFTQGAEISDRLMTEGAILRVLASVGTQMTAFVHEINSILSMVTVLEEAVAEIEQNLVLAPNQRHRLSQLRGSIEELRRGIERQASYLTDIVSPDARRRRARQKLAPLFDAGLRLTAAAVAKRGIEVTNEIPPDLKSPPMFRSELTVVFSNLLTNAVKAAGIDGIIRASGRMDENGRVIIRIENTGVAVSLDEGEKWFRPFESTTTETDPVLGQGMGMGLPITPNILEEYGGLVQFCRPSRGFATAIEITFPK